MRGHRVGGARAAVAAAALLMVSCTEGVDRTGGPDDSAPPPTDAEGGYAYEDAEVRGVVTGVDGRSAGDVDVTVVAGVTSSDQANAFLALMFTGGLACFAGACEATDDVVANVRTGADGAYSAPLPDAYLAGFETDTDWYVTAARPAADGQLLGPTSSLEFETNTPVQQAPPLALWDTSPAMVDGPLLTVDVAPPPDVADASRATTAVQFVDESGQMVWTMTGDTVDARLLEDRPLRLLGLHRADVRVAHEHGRTIYHQRLVTAAVPYTGSRVPPSRGAACTAGPEPVVGCPVTDGVLVSPTASAVQGATVDLAEDSPVGLVVVRGGSGCTVEISSDGEAWTSLPTAPLDGAEGVAATPGDPSSARHVRAGGESCSSIEELSVWPPTAPEPGGPTESGLLRPGENESLGSRGLVAALIAALLAGVVGTLALVRWRSRRHSAEA